MGQNVSKNEEAKSEAHPRTFDHPLRSRKTEVKTLLKKCFKNNLFCLVPFELWQEMVWIVDAKSITMLCQTCWGFKELVESVIGNSLRFALILRREGQIPLALRCLQSCAENGNSSAMFHMGYAYNSGGWGLFKDKEMAREWCKKAAECGSPAGMAFISVLLKNDYDPQNIKKRDLQSVALWGKKAIESKDSFSVGYCYEKGLGTNVDRAKAFKYFEASANKGEELGQYWYAMCFECGNGTEVSIEKAFEWYTKAAEQGDAGSQYNLGLLYREAGEGQEGNKNKQLALFWFKKAAKQMHKNATDELKRKI